MAVKLGKEATFKGESFSDMIAPLKEYATAYKEVEANYDTLAMETEKLKQMMAQEDPSSQAYQTYNDYYNRLNATVTDFAKGMNMRNRSALSGMKRGYAQNIVPINNALTLKKSLVDAQDKARSADKSTIFRKDASTYSIDDLIANPTQGVGDMISGQDIYKNVQHMASNLAKELHKGNPEIMKLFPYTYRLIDRYGWNSDDILKAILNKDNPDNALNYLVNQAVNATGVQNWNDNQGAYQKALEWAAMGAWDAIGETKPTQVYDQYNAALALQNAKADQARKAADKAQKKAIRQAIKSDYIYSQEQNNVLKKLKEAIENGYIARGEDGKWVTTEKWKKNRAKTTSSQQPMPYEVQLLGAPRLEGSAQQNRFLDENGNFDVEGYLRSKGLDPDDLNPDTKSSNWWDTRRRTHYSINLNNKTTKDAIKDAVMNALGNNDAYETVFDAKRNQFVRDKQTNVLTQEKSEITEVGLSPYGYTMKVKDENGDMHQIEIPRNINNTVMSNIDSNMKDILTYINLYNTDGQTDEQKRQYQLIFDELLKQSFLTFMQSQGINKVGNIDYPGGISDQLTYPY